MNISSPSMTPPQEPRRRQSRISADMLLQAFRGAWSRFPVVMAFVMYLAVWAAVYIIFENKFTKESDNLVAALWYFGGVGSLMTLAVSIWSEYLGRGRRVAMALAVLLLVADSLYILSFDSDMNTPWAIGRVALVTALLVAIFFVPVRGKWAWNFTNSQIRGAVTAAVFSWVAGIAVGIIVGTVDVLFDIKIDSFKVIFVINVFMSGVIPTVIFLHFIPRRSEAEAMAEGYAASKFQCGLAKYFFLSLTVVYMAILYVYGAKILFTWQLPRGVVSWSVTGLSAAVLVTMFMLEGVRRTHPADALSARALRVLPAAILPLLLLMSVGVAYRVNQYGFTAPRLYVIVFNLWCYAAFGYLAFCKECRYNRVAISFAVSFVAVAIIPWLNLTELGERLERHSSEEKAEVIVVVDNNQKLQTVSQSVPIIHGYDNVRYKYEYTYVDDSIPADGMLSIGEKKPFRVPVDSLMKIKTDTLAAPLRLYPASGGRDSVYVVNIVEIDYEKKQWKKNRKIRSIITRGYIFTKSK